MKDVVLVLALMAFFGVCVLYVRACGRIMGADEAVDLGAANDDDVATDSAPEVLAGR